MNNLITFYAVSEDGKASMVGVGLTDKIIDHLKKNGAILEDSKRTGMATDVIVMYAPTDKELLAKIESVLPQPPIIRHL